MAQDSLADLLHTTPAHLKKLREMGIHTITDLLHYFPRTLEETAVRRTMAELTTDTKVTLLGRLEFLRSERTRSGKRLFRAGLILEDGAIAVLWFRQPYALRNFTEGTRVFLIGKVKYDHQGYTLLNPEVHTRAGVHVGGLRAIYPESPPITSKWLREKLRPHLGFSKDIPDIVPPAVRQAEGLLPLYQAIQFLHAPRSTDEWTAARRSVAFTEVFGIQLRVMHAKAARHEATSNPYQFTFAPDTVKADIDALPFTLTFAQKKVLFHILSDFGRDRPAQRLVQGDVGAGKTVVALLAAAAMVRAGHQVALMAPTEILAKQHYRKALEFFDDSVHVALLTGSVPAAQKRKLKAALATGQVSVVVGTHALLTADTTFHSLGLAIIDEQHRFGVRQRARLAESGTHLVAMTATPIPRSLALTLYGDQDISVIDELPAGRLPIVTKVIADPRAHTQAVRFIADQIAKQRAIFWVCPLVDESDAIAAKNVLTQYELVRDQLLPDARVEFLHGRMKPDQKDDIMARFRAGEFDVLVSTSVIEVGVDIPHATVMVIENSERFGLSQLHQFRGRIGRNAMQSYCFLMVGKTEDSHKERLRAMEQSNDGFHLSEVDLRLRGAGDLYGTRQSGLPDLKCADLTDTPLLECARRHAESLIESDPTLARHPIQHAWVQAGEVFFSA